MPSTDQSELLVRQKDGKILYAVAYNRLVRDKRTKRRKWLFGEVDYVHAHDAQEAKLAVIRANPGQLDFIGIAPAIGAFIEDEKKGIVSLT